jgi:hypothetical protein
MTAESNSEEDGTLFVWVSLSCDGSLKKFAMDFTPGGSNKELL